MDTPVFDFVQHYSRSGTGRLHMPGHKGSGPLGCESLDITEIKGADALYEAEGILARAEANTTALFGSGASFFSTEGSSQCIRAMLYLAIGQTPKGERPLLLAGRNAHKAFLYACALLDCDVEWLYPDSHSNALLWSCPVTPRQVEQALLRLPRRPAAVYLTSPDYLGQQADLQGIGEVCRRFGTLLAVDNAHGAYLHFLPRPCHPLDLGADLCCDSAHKTLPVLTGGAYLHIGRACAPRLAPHGKKALSLFGSTSPSYLILQSLDLANRALSHTLPAGFAAAAARLDGLKEQLSAAGLSVLPSEPLKLVLHTAAHGCSGQEAAEILRSHSLEPEFADRSALVCMIGPHNTEAELQRLQTALLALPRRAPCPEPPLRFVPLPRAMSIREACLAWAETLPVEEAVGRVCAAPAVSCPPAIAVAVSGEVLTPDAVALFRACGLDTVDVTAL